MKDHIENGGPAFPTPVAADEGFVQPCDNLGMTLLDYFAAQSLATMKLPNSWTDNPLYWEGVARSAYVAAAAMLAERERRMK